MIKVLFDCKVPSNCPNDCTEDINCYDKYLNDYQKEAVRLCLSGNDVSLVYGPPGTGKTSTIIEIILQLVKNNKKILVTAPSNVAVDTLCERLIQAKQTFEVSFEMTRIGHPIRMLTPVIQISIDEIIETRYKITKNIDMLYKEKDKIRQAIRMECNGEEKAKLLNEKRRIKDEIKKMKDYRQLLVFELINNCNVVFSTIGGAGDKDLDKMLNFKGSFFDYVIIDESCQSIESSCFVPIFYGQK